jgi:hypothetical protein
MKTVFAHESESSEGISAIMHIDPNDQPVINSPAQFYFTFQDPAGSFEISHCDCTIILLKDGIELDRQPVAQPNSTFSSLSSYPLYTRTFDQSGNYELELIGSPKDNTAFHPFMLHFEVPVKDSGSTASGYHPMMANEHLGHILIFGGGFVIALAILLQGYWKNRKSKITE